MKTADLDFALKLAQPCVTSIDLVPVMTHYCFNKESVFAYDEVSGIVVGLETNLHCALRGESLMPLVALAGQEVELKQNGDGKVLLRSGSMRAELPGLPPESFIYTEPKEDKKAVQFNLSPEMLAGMAICAMSVGDNPHKREQTAVWLRTGKRPILFAYDGVALVHFRLPGPIGDDERIVLIPKSICDQVIGIKEKVKSTATGVKITLGKHHLVAEFENAKETAQFPVYLIGNLLDLPIEFDEFQAAIKEAAEMEVFALPTHFSRAVERTMVVLSSETEPHCVLALEAGVLKVDGASGLGKAQTELKVKAEHSAKAILDPSRLIKYRDLVTHIGLSEEGVAMYDNPDPKKAQLTYIIGCWGK